MKTKMELNGLESDENSRGKLEVTFTRKKAA